MPTPFLTSRYDLNRDQLSEALDGQPKFRTDQLWTALYDQGIDPSEITTFSKDLRAQVAANPDLRSALKTAVESVTDDGKTVKWLWTLHDGKQVETVLMHYPDRSTACISSQAGCALNCSFCATGQAGFDRQLSVGEIVEQVVRARRRAAADGHRLSNLVFMGMGEPLANFDRVWGAVEKIHGDLGMGARHITISTVGVVPGIRRIAEQELPVNLAVSLHAANDTLRDSLVPLNKRYPLDMLMSACEDYQMIKNRRISFEWALIADTNDREQDARELANLAKPLGAHVNLIPLNPTPGYLVRGSDSAAVARFAHMLNDRGVNVTVRHTRGVEIDAACGQLAARHAPKNKQRQVVSLRERRASPIKVG